MPKLYHLLSPAGDKIRALSYSKKDHNDFVMVLLVVALECKWFDEVG